MSTDHATPTLRETIEELEPPSTLRAVTETLELSPVVDSPGLDDRRG